MNEKVKSIVGIMVIITILSGAFLYWGIRMYQKNMEDKIFETTERTSLLIDHVIKSSLLIYQIRIETLLGDSAILSAFNDRDRKKLFELTLPWHQALTNANPFYSNMHFHLPDGRSFLRMHKPKDFGDDLKKLRPIIMEVHETKEKQHAYEIGKHGLFYRVANPIFYNNKYIGALEVGIRVDETAKNIEEVLGVHVARFISNTDLNPAFRKFRNMEIQSQNRFINPYNDDVFFQRAVGMFDFDNLAPQRSIIGGKHFVLFQAGNLKNFKNRTIAKFLVAQDISIEMADYRTFIRNSLLLTLLLIAGAYIVLHFSFGAMIEKIIELNRTLEARVRERTKSLEEVNTEVLYANAELNQVINTAADGMRIIDKNYTVLRVNDTFIKLMGKQSGELEKRPCHEWFKGVLCFTPDCTLRRILNGEKRVEIDVERTVANGEIKSFLLTATPYTSPEGKILGVVENFKDITERKNISRALKEKEEYLNAVMETVQTGLIVTDTNGPTIINANPYAAELIGCPVKELINSRQDKYFRIKKSWIKRALVAGKQFQKEDCLLRTVQGQTLVVRLSIASVKIKEKIFLVQSFSDITDIKRLLEMQAVDIHKAKSIMTLVNGEMPKYSALKEDCRIFTRVISAPCHAEGGDHFFVRHFKSDSSGSGKSFISLKDQSGHEVNCILRSIYTDLIHNAYLHQLKHSGIKNIMSCLNNELCAAPFFEADDYFTSITAELDHDSLVLSYVSSGHPPFLLIRENNVQFFPAPGTENHLPIPFIADADYTSAQLPLEKSDQLIFYTDGLMEMTLKNKGRVLSAGDLSHICQDIIDAHRLNAASPLPVSDLMQKLLGHVCLLSAETVNEGSNDHPPVNTSLDDVTLLGMEIETSGRSKEARLFFKNTAEVSTAILRLNENIFSQDEAGPFLHLKSSAMVIFEETLLNAWIHGNKKDPQKPIVIRWQFYNNFIFEVIDQGAGFDFHRLPDPTKEENIKKSCGRGLFLIYQFSDHVQFRENGSHIIVSFKKDDMPGNKKAKVQNRINLWQV